MRGAILYILHNYLCIGLAVNAIFIVGYSLYERYRDGYWIFEGSVKSWYEYWFVCVPILYIAWGIFIVPFWFIALPIMVVALIDEIRYKRYRKKEYLFNNLRHTADY